MGSDTIISSLLDAIGWGKYQRYVFTTCLLGLILTMFWTESVAILSNTIDASENEKFALITCLNVGTLLGCFVLSWLSGIYGRSAIFKFDIILACIGGTMCSISEYLLYPGLLLVGLGTGGDMSIAFTVFMESIPISCITYMSFLNSAWSLGPALSALVSLGLTELATDKIPLWTLLVWLTTIATFFATFHRLSILESPYFLYTIRSKNSFDVIRKIAEYNSNKTFEIKYDVIVDEEEIIENKESIFQCSYIKLTTWLTLVYLFSSLGYYILLFHSNIFISGSEKFVYIVVAIQQFVGVFGTFMASYLMNGILGRRGVQVAFFGMSSLFTLMLLVSTDVAFIIITSSLIYVSMMAGLSSLYTHTQELYPVLLRGDACGWFNGILFSSAIVSPLLISSIKNYVETSIVIAITSGFFMLSSLFAMLLTETKDYYYKKC